MDKGKNRSETPQIIDVVLKGGSPWGLSLKGGFETSSALVISKVRTIPIFSNFTDNFVVF
jgi:hypothetical protein